MFHCVHFECPAQCEVERHTDEPPEPEQEQAEAEGAAAAGAGAAAEPEPEGAVGGERRFSFELDKWEPPEDGGGGLFGGQAEP